MCWGIFRFSRSEPGEVVSQGGSSSTSLVGALTPAAEQFSGLGTFFFPPLNNSYVFLSTVEALPFMVFVVKYPHW